MLTQTIEIPKDKAQKSYIAYRELVKRQHSKEAEMLKKAYRAASQGKRLVDIQSIFEKIGIDENHRPKLAISRAGHEWVYYHCHGLNSRPQFSVDSLWAKGAWKHVRLQQGTFPKCAQVKAMVPIVPAHLRPDASITNYHILFEPRWESVPADPMLLKHLGGSLYVVLASWDETPLENAVLRMALT